MVDIQSKEVIDKISDELKIQPAMAIPRALAEKIQLVYDIGAVKKGFVVIFERNITGSGVAFTVPNDNHDYFLVGARIAITADATYDGNEVLIRCDTADDGKTDVKVLSLRHNDAGAAAIAFQDGQVSFAVAPIRLTAGSFIDVVNVFTVGSLETTSIIHMFKTARQ